MLIHIKLSTNR